MGFRAAHSTLSREPQVGDVPQGAAALSPAAVGHEADEGRPRGPARPLPDQEQDLARAGDPPQQRAATQQPPLRHQWNTRYISITLSFT